MKLCYTKQKVLCSPERGTFVVSSSVARLHLPKEANNLGNRTPGAIKSKLLTYDVTERLYDA